MGLPKFKGRKGWVYQGLREGYRIGLPRFKRRIGWVYQGLREG